MVLLRAGGTKTKTDIKRISVHHIGGRDGSRAFPILGKFEKDIINVLYEANADPDCLAQIKEMNQNLESELHVLPYCLGDACKSTYLNINYDPYTSSLYALNPDYSLYYKYYCNCDYIASEVCKTVERRFVKMVTLDHIFQSKNTSIPPPDFLSFDTGGTEYEILSGAKETLKSNVVAVVLEAMFHPLYKGQKLFGDLTKLLSDLGFNFVRFLSMHDLTSFRAPIGLRAEGSHAYCDVLFLRRIDNIKDNVDELKYYFMLRKLAFIAIIFNQFEYGLECLRQSKDLVAHHSTAQEEELVYLRFLRELEQHIAKMPKVYPPTFVSKYPTFAESKLRSESSAVNKAKMQNETGATHRIKQLLKQIRMLYLLLKWFKGILVKLFSINKFFSKVVSSVTSMFTGYTDVEEALIKYGLKNQAKLLRKSRIIQK